MLVEVEPEDVLEGARHNIYFNPVSNALRRRFSHTWIECNRLAHVTNVGYFILDQATQRKLRLYDQGDVFFLPHIIELEQHHVYFWLPDCARRARDAQAEARAN
jgi:hypothetical protein